MTNRDRKIAEIRNTWITAVKRKQELVNELWKVEEIESKTKQLLFKYGEEDIMGMVQETTNVVENHNCPCSCNDCHIRCRLGILLFGTAQSDTKCI